MIKSALCTVLLVATATPAFAEKPDLSDPKVSKLLMMSSTGEVIRRPETCGTPQTPPANYDPNAASQFTANALNEPQIIYMNKNGGTFTTTGTTSAANNTLDGSSSFKAGTVTPLPAGDFDWPLIVQCVKDAYAPFNVTVVETEPTGVPYVEAVVGGNDGTEVTTVPFELFGIAATDSFCNLFRTGIAFNFAGTHSSAFSNATVRNRELCNTIAHEVGHVLGLEHEVLDRDHMSYVYITDACTAGQYATCKSFLNEMSRCGTEGQGMPNCSCGGTRTNSYAKLLDYIGPSNTVPDTVAPTLSIVTPTDFTSMPRDFDVTVMATDDRAVSSVAILVDGTQVDMATAPTTGTNYVLSIADATEGQHTLVASAVDSSGNTQMTTVEFTVVLAQTGDECTTNEECSGGICAQSSSGRFCTEECTDNSCPTDFSCTTISSGQMICVPDPSGTDDGDDMTDADDNTDGNNATDGDGGGCCSTSSGTGALSGGLLALGVGLVVSRRRRR